MDDTQSNTCCDAGQAEFAEPPPWVGQPGIAKRLANPVRMHKVVR